MTYDEVDEKARREDFERTQQAKEILKLAKAAQEENLEKILKKQKEAAIKRNVNELLE